MKLVRKVLLFLVVIFAVFYLVTRPQDAAAAVRTAFGAASKAFSSIMLFFTTLVG
jgi:preprotein translocase subunit YajC